MFMSLGNALPHRYDQAKTFGPYGPKKPNRSDVDEGVGPGRRHPRVRPGGVARDAEGRECECAAVGVERRWKARGIARRRAAAEIEGPEIDARVDHGDRHSRSVDPELVPCLTRPGEVDHLAHCRFWPSG